MNKLKLSRYNSQEGAVSLFVVIFATLLITVVTISFIQLMLKDQQQATITDLSRSAYDSAQAGVEDAKRLLLLDQSCRNGSAASTINCGAIAAALTPAVGQSETDCDTLAQSGIVGQTNNETIIQQTVGDNADKLDQAYTCVKIGVNTDDVSRKVEVDKSTVVPLRGVGEFDTIEVSWFHKDDISSQTTDTTISFPSVGADVSLPPVGSKWQFNYPALLRTQLIQTGGSFKLTDFDNSQPDNKSNTNTLFLYPSATGIQDKDFALDARRSPTNTPQQVRCATSFATTIYACTAVIKLPVPIDGNVANRNAYLRVSPLYNGASIRVKLKKGADYVKFDGVQPIVDSTGRANDLFRRVQARIELKGEFTSPEAAIDLGGDLCKNFSVTDNDAGYKNSSTCTP